MSGFHGKIIQNKIYSPKVKTKIRTLTIADLHNVTNSIRSTKRLINAINDQKQT